jgi:putative flippase GtrA
VKKLFDKIINTFFKKDFLIFIIIGIINTFNGTLFSMLYSKIFQPNLAFVFGYATSLIISYLLNSFFTFKSNLAFNKFIKFCISYVPNFIVQFVSVCIIYNLLGFDKIIAYLAAAVIGIPVTFLILKFYAFATKKNTSE